MSKHEDQGFVVGLHGRDFGLSDCSCIVKEKAVLAAIPKLTKFLNENLHNAREAYALMALYKASLEKIYGFHSHTVDMTEQLKKGPQA